MHLKSKLPILFIGTGIVWSSWVNADTTDSQAEQTNTHSKTSDILEKTPTSNKKAALTEKTTGPNIYVDKTINDKTLQPTILFGDNEDVNYNTEGLPRYLRVDAISNISKSSDSNGSKENGLSINAQFETEQYGAFSINGIFRNEPNGKAGSIIQRKVHFDDGWYANNGAGTLYTPAINLTRNQARFYIPTFPIFGISTEWVHDDDMQLQFATGTPGVFDGLQLNSFRQLNGNISMVGGQWNLSPEWQLGTQIVSTRDVSSVSGANNSLNQLFGSLNTNDTKINSQSAYASAIHLGEDFKLQGNLLYSESDEHPNALGIWLDGKKKLGKTVHSLGLFRLEPQLSWGYTPISNDIEGIYYRTSYNSRQFLLDGGVDAVKSISGNGANGVLVTSSVRYQISQALGVGGSMTYRDSDTDAYGGYLFTDLINKYGSSRAQLDYSKEDSREQERLTLSQNWRVSSGSRLNTAIYSEIEKNASEHINHFGTSLNGGSDLSSNISWNGNLNYERSNGNTERRTISANFDLSARINNHWSLITSYLKTQNRVTNPNIVQPLIPIQLSSETTSGSTFFITLRYETRSGTQSIPLGGNSGSAAGSINGFLFLDANDNGNLDANEEPAQNITVLLDEKFTTRTNARGQFEFPLVAIGDHTVTIIPDNLPLPWQVSDEGQRTITVNTRKTSYINIPASRFK